MQDPTLNPSAVAAFHALDLETFPIRHSERLPAPVCAQVGPQGEILPAWDPDFDAILSAVLSQGVTGHNIAGFDLPVLAFRSHALRLAVFDSLQGNRVWDCMIADRLGKIARGWNAKAWSGLGDLAKQRCRIELDKSGDSFRTRYGELWGKPIKAWPPAAVSYAKADGVATHAVAQSQLAKYPGGLVRDMGHQCRAAFSLSVMSAAGFSTDPAIVEGEFTKWLRRKARLFALAFRKYKIAKADGSKSNKAIQAYAIELEKRIRLLPGRESLELFPRTDKGALSITQDTIPDAWAKLEIIEVEHPGATQSAGFALAAMRCASKYAEAQRLTGDGQTKGILTHLRGIDEAGRFTYVTHARYDSLKETGRTGTSNPTVQNLPRKGRIRNCFTARPGFVLVSIDFSMLELVTLAQCCLARVGFSRLAELINRKVDVHTWMGAQFAGVPYEWAEALKADPTRKKEWKAWAMKWRQMAKAFNFGLPGGLGADKFILLAHRDYGVSLTKAEFLNYRNIYRSALPEVPIYQRIVGGQLVLEHTISRRLQGGLTYNSACNSDFQALGSDVMKAAVWAVTWECYHPSGRLHGVIPVAEIHDELIAEIPITENLTAVADFLTEVWISAGQVWVPNVRLSAEPALMTHWDKAAECVRDLSGNLLVYQVAA